MAEVGSTLALIGAPGEQLLHSVATPPIETPEPAEPIVAVVGSEPLEALTLHRLARDLSVDFASITGTGPGGRVTEADVRAAAAPPRAGGCPCAGSGARSSSRSSARTARSRP